MPRLLVPVLALLLGGASSFLVACGDRNGLLPPSKADAMVRYLNSVSDAIGSGHCGAAEAAVSRAKNVLHSATTARRTLTDRLRSEFDQLGSVASTQCQSTTTSDTSSTQTSNTVTTTPTTTSTTTTRPSTTTSTPSTQTSDTTSTTDSTSTTQSTDTGGTSGGAAPGGGGNNGGGQAGNGAFHAHGRGHGDGGD